MMMDVTFIWMKFMARDFIALNKVIPITDDDGDDDDDDDDDNVSSSKFIKIPLSFFRRIFNF